MALTRKGIFNLSKAYSRYDFLGGSRKCPSVLSFNSSSKHPEKKEQQDAGELFGEGADGESHKDNESVSEIGGRIHEITEKIKENAEDCMERTGRKIKEVTGSDPRNSESIMEGSVDGEELKGKLGKEPGGKPVDEDKGLDVNWRPIDEKKS